MCSEPEFGSINCLGPFPSSDFVCASLQLLFLLSHALDSAHHQKYTSEGLLGYPVYLVRVSELGIAVLYDIVDIEHIDEKVQKWIVLCQVFESVSDEDIGRGHLNDLIDIEQRAEDCILEFRHHESVGQDICVEQSRVMSHTKSRTFESGDLLLVKPIYEDVEVLCFMSSRVLTPSSVSLKLPERAPRKYSE